MLKMAVEAKDLGLAHADRSGLIGQHDALMVGRLAVTLRLVWARLHRVGRSEAMSLEGRYRVHQVVGAFSAMWSAMQALNVRRFRNGDVAAKTLISHLSRKGVRESLCAQSCTLLSMFASRRDAMLGLAQGAKSRGECNQHLAAARFLERNFWEILYTGVLAEMPNSLRVVELDEKSLERLSTQLITLFHDLERVCEKQTLPSNVLVLLGRLSGLSLFEGVRAQKEGRVAPGTVALAAWYHRKRNRSLRGFHATLGLGLHEFGVVYAQLLQSAATSCDRGQANEILALSNSLRSSAFAIFSTGTLSAVPA